MCNFIAQIGIAIFGITAIILVTKKISGVLFWDYFPNRFGLLLH